MLRDVYEVLSDIADRWLKKHKPYSLSEYLKSIGELLDYVNEKFQQGTIPRSESKQLAVLINHSRSIADEFRNQMDVKTQEIFDEDMPKIGWYMRSANFFMGELNSYDLDSSFTEATVTHDGFRQALSEVCKELERITGRIKGYVEVLRIKKQLGG